MMYQLYHAPILLPSAGISRRERERMAVEGLVRRVFGPKALLTHDANGAPLIDDSRGRYISISHSIDTCVLALSATGPIGVDTETARAQLLRVAGKFISPAEEPFVPHEVPSLLRAWAAKEAVYKAALTPGLALTDILLSPTLRQAAAAGKTFSIDFPLLKPGRVTAVAMVTRPTSR